MAFLRGRPNFALRLFGPLDAPRTHIALADSAGPARGNLRLGGNDSLDDTVGILWRPLLTPTKPWLFILFVFHGVFGALSASPGTLVSWNRLLAKHQLFQENPKLKDLPEQ
jgi:hypothetical protein